MSLTEGIRFGPYEIAEQIGSGGMGEVWRATDTELGRDVAVKVLSRSFIDDADRLARFRREAELLAALNHPNIATIHGLEKAGDQTVIVMELVEGPTLADRIRKGPIPPDEAMGIALQIVAALEAAHRKQIVHRDLKPANIKVRDDGTVKVLDFGISKPIDPAAISGGSPVATTPAVTQTGVILGTAAYMSPEQARGRFVDERTDVWAFGCVLFEMLTGQPAFDGEDVMLTLARVLDRETDLSSMPKMISPAVRHTIRLCLEKDPGKRIADIRDVRLALEGKFETGETGSTEALPESRSGARRAFAAVAGLVVGALAAGLTVWTAIQPAEPIVGRFVVPMQGQTIATSSPSLEFAPSGRSFAYLVGGDRRSGAAELHLRHRGRIEPEILITDGVVASPFFSPDETKIGFYENRGPLFLLKYVTVETREVSEIGRLTDNLRGASWGADGWIVVGQAENAAGLWRVHENGGDLERLTTPTADEVAHFWPEILPGGDAVVFTIIGAAREQSEIAVVSLVEDDAPVIRLGVYGHFATYSPTGHLVFARENSLWAVAFDPVSFATGVVTSRLEEGVMSKQYDDATEFSLSANGDLVFVSADDLAETGRRLIWVEADSGNAEPVTAELGRIDDVAMSPDMSKAAVTAGAGSGIRIIDLERGGAVTLTSDVSALYPLFSPDSQQIVYVTSSDGRPDILLQSADGSGSATSVAPELSPQIIGVAPTSWSATDTLVLNLAWDDGGFGIGFLDVDDPESFDVRRSPGRNRTNGAISPSGLWLTYMELDSVSSAPAVFIERLSDGRGRARVSPLGGLFPTWSDDGTALTYVSLDRGPTAAVRVTIAGESAPDFPLGLGDERELFPWTYAAPQNLGKFFDLSPAGDRLLVISGDFGDDTDTASTVLVLNWLTEMKQLGRLPDGI